MQDDPRRDEFLSKIGDYVSKLIRYSAADEMMDQIAAENVHSSLPPCLSKGVIICSISAMDGEAFTIVSLFR